MKYVITKIGEVILFGDDVNHSDVVRKEHAKSAGFVTIRGAISPTGKPTITVRCHGASRTLDLLPAAGDPLAIAQALGYVRFKDYYVLPID